MGVIELDATDWLNILDAYDALMRALGSPEWHGKNINALIDSMVYGGINRVDPPYLIRIRGTAKCPENIRQEVELWAGAIRKARADQRQRYGKETNVGFEISP